MDNHFLICFVWILNLTLQDSTLSSEVKTCVFRQAGVKELMVLSDSHTFQAPCLKSPKSRSICVDILYLNMM